jgi:hypothetical protein
LSLKGNCDLFLKESENILDAEEQWNQLIKAKFQLEAKIRGDQESPR